MKIHVLEYFEATARAMPGRVALFDGSQSMTFGELRRRALAVAARVHALAGPGIHPVGLLLPKSNDWIVALLAALYAGKIYAPLDQKVPVARLRAVLQNLEPAAVIVTARTKALAVEAGISDDRLVSLDEALPEDSAELSAWRGLVDADPAYIIHTSGSTGVPKGVVISHRSIVDYIDWAIETYRIDGREVIGNQAPYYFDNSTLDFYLSFATGATLVLIPEGLFTFPAKLLEFMAEQRVSFLFWVPSILVNVANLGLLSGRWRPPLEKILFAGEVMPNRQLNQWRAAYPVALFSNLYGPTEITVDCTYLIVDRPFADDEPLPIGIPCRNSDVLILDEQNRPCVGGGQGELCVRGTSLALGYWNNPAKTAAAFVQNPLQPHYPERIYRTGDLVHCNERGEIMFDGRKDHQIKHLGYRIELGEIEAAALALPQIANACVLYDAARKAILLVYEAAQELTPAAIRQGLSERLPKYMFPSVFHRVELMPRNASGKIDRQQLAQTLMKGP